MVEPVDPFHGCVFDVVDRAPGPALADQLGLVQADDRLRQRVVVRGAYAADRGFDAGLSEPLRVADRDVLPRLKWSSQHCCL